MGTVFTVLSISQIIDDFVLRKTIVKSRHYCHKYAVSLTNVNNHISLFQHSLLIPKADAFLAYRHSKYGFQTNVTLSGLQPLQSEESEKPSGKVPEGDSSTSRVLQDRQETHPNFRK